MAESEEPTEQMFNEFQNNWTKQCAEQQTQVLEKITNKIESGCLDFTIPLENIRITEEDQILNVIKYIDTTSVKCLLMLGIGWAGYVDTQVINHILNMTCLKKIINRGYFHIPTQDLVNILHNCKSTLTVIDLEYNDLSTIEDVSNLFREIQNLDVIRLTQVKLTHYQIIEMSNFLSRYPRITEIHLDAVKCCECNWCHITIPLDLSQNVNLRNLTLKDMDVEIIGINTSKLETCTFSQLHVDGTCQAIYKSLTNAPLLKVYSSRTLDDSLDDFCRMIPTLNNLQYFELSWAHLGEYEIIFSKAMTKLKELKFIGVNMYSNTLYKMIKSLPSVPHPIKVTLDPQQTLPISADIVFQDLQRNTGLRISHGVKSDREYLQTFYIRSQSKRD